MPLFPDQASRAQATLDLQHTPASSRADFLVSENNREAVLWIDRWPEWPGHTLAVSGPAGCGKSHLAQIWRARAYADPVDLSQLAEGSAAGLLQRRRNLVIDDASAVAGQPAFERSLFHLYNGLRENGGYLLLTDAAPPARWPVMLPDLKSRLAGMQSISIAPPDDDLLKSLFAKLFSDRQVRVSPDVFAYLVPRMERSFAAVNRLAARLDELALARGGPIGIATARLALDEDPQG